LGGRSPLKIYNYNNNRKKIKYKIRQELLRNGLELWRGEWVISGLERLKVSDDRHHLDTAYYDKSSNPMLLTL